jgi:hypothetical protein
MRLDWTEPRLWRPFVAGISETCSPADIAHRVRSRFTSLRAFHAARPLDTAPYYRVGIQPLSRDRWHELVEDCFLNHARDPRLIAAIERARDVQYDLVRAGRVHFCCDERLLEQRDGYTLIYGSLSLLAVAIQLDKRFGTDFKAMLRQRGAPVVFVCDIPVELIEDDELARLVPHLIEHRERASETDRSAALLAFHFSIPVGLPPAAIVGHHRPRRAVDSVYGHDLVSE